MITRPTDRPNNLKCLKWNNPVAVCQSKSRMENENQAEQGRFTIYIAIFTMAATAMGMQMKWEETLNNVLRMKSLHPSPLQKGLFRNVGRSMHSFMFTAYVDSLKVMTLTWLSVNNARSGSTLSAWSLWLNQTPWSAHSVHNFDLGLICTWLFITMCFRVTVIS